MAEGHLMEDKGIPNRVCSYKVGPALADHSTTLLSKKNLNC